MPNQQEYKTLIDTIKQQLEFFRTVRTEEHLIRESELGTQLSFQSGRSLFQVVIEYMNRVADIDLFSIPYNTLNQFSSHLRNSIKTLESIKSFSPNTNSPAQVRDNLVNQLDAQFHEIFPNLIQILSVGVVNKTDDNVERKKKDELLKNLEEDVTRAKQQSEGHVKELQELLTKAKQAAAEVGVAQHSIVFAQEYEHHDKLADKWLGITIAVLALTLALGISLLFVDNMWGETTFHLVQFTITKIVVLTILFYGLSICTKNYKAHKHNSIVNKHRQNALSTFETFSKAATDSQTKNAVLLETTHAIFSSQNTGYLTNDGEGDMPNKIIEIIKDNNNKQA